MKALLLICVKHRRVLNSDNKSVFEEKPRAPCRCSVAMIDVVTKLLCVV